MSNIFFRWRALPCARTCATAIHRATISLGVRESTQSSGNSASYSQDVDSRDGLAQTVTQDWGENIVPSRALRCGGAFNLDFSKLAWFKCTPFRGIVELIVAFILLYYSNRLTYRYSCLKVVMLFSEMCPKTVNNVTKNYPNTKMSLNPKKTSTFLLQKLTEN